MNDMGMYFIVNQLFILYSISCSEEYVGEYNQAAIKYFLEETEDFFVTNNEDSRIIQDLIDELTGLQRSMRTILGECKNLDSILARNDGKDGRNTGYKNLKSFFDIVCLEDVLGTNLEYLRVRNYPFVYEITLYQSALSIHVKNIKVVIIEMESALAMPNAICLALKNTDDINCTFGVCFYQRRNLLSAMFSQLQLLPRMIQLPKQSYELILAYLRILDQQKVVIWRILEKSKNKLNNLYRSEANVFHDMFMIVSTAGKEWENTPTMNTIFEAFNSPNVNEMQAMLQGSTSCFVQQNGMQAMPQGSTSCFVQQNGMQAVPQGSTLCFIQQNGMQAMPQGSTLCFIQQNGMQAMPQGSTSCFVQQNGMQAMPQRSTVDFNATYCQNNTNQEQVVFEHVPCTNLTPGFPPTTNQWKRKINYNFSDPSPSKQVKTDSSSNKILISLLNQSDEDLNPHVPSNKDNPSTSDDKEEEKFSTCPSTD